MPAEIRKELNRRLHNGQNGRTVLPWLNGLEDVRTVLAQAFDGRAINSQNLSAWREGGYQEWLTHEGRAQHTRQLAERAAELARASGGALSEGAAAIAAGRMLELLETCTDPALPDDKQLGPEQLSDIIEDLAKLRATDIAKQRADQDALKIGQKDVELKLARQKFQRETAELFLKWHSNQRATEIASSSLSNADKIETLGKQMFGDLWE